MTIAFKQGNLLTEPVDVLVCPVNCVGVMGKGLALQFKRQFPDNFRAYRQACRDGVLRPGRVLSVPTGQPLPRYVINLPTKRHWRNPSRLDDVDAGLKALAIELQMLDVTSIAIPALGCGLGGLDWSQVKPFVVATFAEFPELLVVVFEPRLKGKST